MIARAELSFDYVIFLIPFSLQLQQKHTQLQLILHPQKPNQQLLNHVHSITSNAKRMENAFMIHGCVMVKQTVLMVRMSQEDFVAKELVAHLSLPVRMENAFKVISSVTVLTIVEITLMKKNVAVSFYINFC